MNTNVLLLTPYSFTNYGGVQNQIKLISKTLQNLNYETKVCSPNSYDFNLGKVINLPFNKSS